MEQTLARYGAVGSRHAESGLLVRSQKGPHNKRSHSSSLHYLTPVEFEAHGSHAHLHGHFRSKNRRESDRSWGSSSAPAAPARSARVRATIHHGVLYCQRQLHPWLWFAHCARGAD